MRPDGGFERSARQSEIGLGAHVGPHRAGERTAILHVVNARQVVVERG